MAVTSPPSASRARRVRPATARAAADGHRTVYRWLTIGALSVIAATIVVPVVWVVLASFRERSEFFGSPWVLPQGLYWENFREAFFVAEMGSYMLNSVMVTAMALAMSLVVAVPAAYAIARFEFRGKSTLELFLLAGLFINVNYIVVPIFLMLIGWDRALQGLMPGGFFIDNLFVLALVYAATSLPFTIYLLTTFLRTIPGVYEEAAMLDGASRLRTMVLIIVPMALPAINTVVLFNFLAFWNDFIISLTLLPGPDKTVQVGLLNLFTAQRAAADYGRLYAGMVIVMVPALILYALVQRRLLQGVSTGADK